MPMAVTDSCFNAMMEMEEIIQMWTTFNLFLMTGPLSWQFQIDIQQQVNKQS